jgi:hypothetical protein
LYAAIAQGFGKLDQCVGFDGHRVSPLYDGLYNSRPCLVLEDSKKTVRRLSAADQRPLASPAQ